MGGSFRGFSTFCHISQFGESGYRALPRMLAMSRPVNLWAPSSIVLRTDACGLSPRTFLKYVESGEIRILGREEWILHPQLRGSERWPNTVWDPEIDGEIRRLFHEDSAKPVGERRVVVAPPENGYEFADRYLIENPGQVARWERVLRSGARRSLIPGGTLEAALRDIGDPELAVRRILRDAYNHGQAFAYSGTDAPILPTLTHRNFLRILSRAPGQSAPSLDPGRMRDQPMSDKYLSLKLSNVAGQLLTILQELDVHSRNRGRTDSLDDFIRGDGRRELMQWMAQVCDILKQVKPSTVDRLILEQLRSDLTNSRFLGILEQISTRADEPTVGVVGILATIVGLVTDPVGPAALMGLAASAYPVGKGLMRELGYAPSTFVGPQWPFLYTYGTRPKKNQLEQLRYVLDQLGQQLDQE